MEHRPAKMLIDTGAAVTLVHQRLLLHNILETRRSNTRHHPTTQIRPTNRRVTGVTGTALDIVGEATLEFSINGLVTNHTCLIVAEMEHDAILGYDFLKAEGFTLDFSEPGRSKSNTKQSAYLRLPGEVHIPALSQKFLRVTPSRRLDLCLEARIVPINVTTPGIWVEDAVASIDEDGKVLVCIGNMNAYGVTLPRRTRVASVFSYQGERVNNIQVSDWVRHCVETTDIVEGCYKVTEAVKDVPSKDESIARQTKRTNTILSLMDLSTLTRQQSQIVQRLVNQHPGSFGLDGEPLTATPLTQYSIPTGNALPIRKRPYRIPECHKKPLKELLDGMLKEGIIAPSRSEWSAPIILIPKKDGRLRIVNDYRCLNKITTRDAYPLPRIEDLLSQLKNARCFTVLDMRSSFYQVKINPHDRKKTAFVCIFGLFEYLRMSMGMSNAPGCFQRLLETIFADMADEGVAIFIDDILLYTETPEQHEKLLAKVLKRLEEAQLTLRPEKCQFFKSEVQYLGHLISASGVYPLKANVQKVLNFPIPKNVEQLRSFHGLATYYRKFIKGFAEIAKPLTELTKKNKPWTWGKSEQQAFDTLKEKLVNPPILCYPRFDSPFILQTDASDKTIGAVLGQEQDGLVRVVSYGSRNLTPAELNYSTIEKEALSIVHFVEEYRHYLLGHHFIIETDHAPLSLLNKAAEPKGRLGRWALKLSEFDYELKYRPARENMNADGLSRIPITPSTSVDQVHNMEFDDSQDLDKEDLISVSKIKTCQQKDEFCRSMIAYLRRKELPVQNEKLTKQVVFEASRHLIRGDGLLTYIPNHNVYSAPEMGAYPVIVLPEPLRDTALLLLHDNLSSGHLGFQKTLKKVQQRFFWPQMYSYIEKYTKKCDSCAKVKTPPTLRRAPHAVFTCATKPMEAVQIDFVGAITPKANDGSSVILVVTDLFTRYAEAYCLPDQTAPLVARTLVTQFFCRYGTPTKIHSDQGPNFKSNLIKEIMKLYNVHHVKGSAYRPSSQGSVERLNRSLIEMLKHFTTIDVMEWSEYVPYVISAYNSSVNASTLYTPYELFFGRTVQLPLDVLIHKPSPGYKDVNGYHQEVTKRLHEAHQVARLNAAEARRAQAKHYNYRAKKRDFRVGDKVYVTNEAKNAKRRKGTDENGNVDSRKFRLNWMGPYTIIQQKGEVVYEVRNDSTGKLETVHENRLKLSYESKLARRTTTRNATKVQKPKGKRHLRSANRDQHRQREVRDWWKVEEEEYGDLSDSEDSADEMVVEDENTTEETNDKDDKNGNGETTNSDEDSDDNSDEDNDDDIPGHELTDSMEEDVEDISGTPDDYLDQEKGPETQQEDMNHYSPQTSPLTPQNNEKTPPVLQDLSKTPQLQPNLSLPELSPQEAGINLRATAPDFRPGNDWWKNLGASPSVKRVSSPKGGMSSNPLAEERKLELRQLFLKDWEKKIKHESKFQSKCTINLKKYSRSEEELKFVQSLLQQHEATYQRGTPEKYPNTRRAQKNMNSSRETALSSKLVEVHFSRGKVIDGKYCQHNYLTQGNISRA